MSTKINISTWQVKFANGEFDAADVDTQVKAGWYDWFCKNESLGKRTQKLGKKVIQIAKGSKFNNDDHYVFFKNNCPMVGGTYDSFSICDLDKGDVQFWIGSPHASSDNKWEVFGVQNDFRRPLAKGNWNDIKKWFLAA